MVRVLIGLALAVAPLGAQTLCEQIKALTLSPAVAAAHWGVAVTTLDGTLVCGIDEGKLFRPASNNKIFTTATALALLGPEKTFTTRVVAKGALSGGVLDGDLSLVGGGDANFGSGDLPYVAPLDRPATPSPRSPTIADIETLADEVAARGLRTIRGDILGDDRYFAWEPYPPDWSLDDMVYGYAAPISALTIHDNQLEVDVTAQKPGAKARITETPDVPYYALDASVYTMNVGTMDFGGSCDERLSFRRAPGSKTLVVFGDIRPQTLQCSQNVAIDDPAEYAALALKLALERRGITVSGQAKALHHDSRILGNVFTERPDNDSFLRGVISHPHAVIDCGSQRAEDSWATATPPLELASHASMPLLADVTYTSKVSQNLHAEVLLRDLGAAFSCAGASQRDGLHVVRQYVLYAGVKPHDFVLYDGSGLSGHDLVAPRAFAKFLAFAAAQPWFTAWKATLPQGGVDGSLASRFNTPGLKGRIFAKTGTLGESRALSGYATTAAGTTLVFSVMVDTHLPGSADRVAMDKIVELIAGAR